MPLAYKPNRFRHTRQRQQILESLRKVDTHPTADEVYAMVRNMLPNISLATVYRNLEVLARMGEILRIDTGVGVMRFDGRTDPHCHLYCTQCHRIVDARMPELPRVEDLLQDTSGFQIVGHRLEFLGICALCLKGCVR